MIIVLLSTLMLAHAAESAGLPTPAAEGCQVALTSPILLPHEIVVYDRDDRAREITARARGVIVEQPGSRGVNAAFALVEGSVSPTLENVAAFLRTRRNYPTVFERNEAAEQTSVVHGELATRLEELKSQGVPVITGPSWQFWKVWSTTPAADTPFAIRRIRILHHHLIEMSRVLRESTAMVERVLETAVALNESLQREFDVLGRIGGEIRDDEFNRRVIVLRQDLTVQTQFTRNLVTSLEQRIQFDAITQDRVRTLLNVILPTVAMMGNSEIDLSPLAPEEAARTGLAAEATDPGDCNARVSVDAIIRLADKTTDPDVANQHIENYVRKYAALLSVTEVLRLGKEAKTWANNDQMLLGYMNVNLARLSIPEVSKLVDGIYDWDTSDEALVTYAKHYARTMSGDELVGLAEKTNADASKRKIMALVNL